MSWSSNVRVLGVCGVWLLALPGLRWQSLGPSADRRSLRRRELGRQRRQRQGRQQRTAASTSATRRDGRNRRRGRRRSRPTYAATTSSSPESSATTATRTTTTAAPLTVPRSIRLRLLGRRRALRAGRHLRQRRARGRRAVRRQEHGRRRRLRRRLQRGRRTAGSACALASRAWRLSVCGNGVRRARRGMRRRSAAPVAATAATTCARSKLATSARTPGRRASSKSAATACARPTKSATTTIHPSPVTAAPPPATVEAGWHCNAMGCKPECGDGLVRGAEACDDNNAIGGDGCSSGCKVEPFFKCTAGQRQSVCTPALPQSRLAATAWSTRSTGNVITRLRECSRKARWLQRHLHRTSCRNLRACRCGNSIVEAGEECDPPAVGNGCSATCAGRSRLHLSASWRLLREPDLRRQHRRLRAG